DRQTDSRCSQGFHQCINAGREGQLSEEYSRPRNTSNRKAEIALRGTGCNRQPTKLLHSSNRSETDAGDTGNRVVHLELDDTMSNTPKPDGEERKTPTEELASL